MYRSYRINGDCGDPDIRKESIYYGLHFGHEKISTPKGIREGFGTNKWIYGINAASPIYTAPNNTPITRTQLDNTKFEIPHDVYAMNTRAIIINKLESDFQPPIYTPEEAKFVQGDQTRYSR